MKYRMRRLMVYAAALLLAALAAVLIFNACSTDGGASGRTGESTGPTGENTGPQGTDAGESADGTTEGTEPVTTAGAAKTTAGPGSTTAKPNATAKPKTTTTAKKTDAPAGTGIVNRTVAYTSAQLYKDVAAIKAAYPDIVGTGSIGKSVLGKDLTLVRLGKGSRKVLWVGGIHSREVVTVNFLMKLLEDYAAAYTRGEKYGSYSAAQVKEALETFTVYLVPLSNPDGTDICTAGGKANVTVSDRKMWKNNANGVNLNRNFPFHWEKSTTSKKENYFKGDSAGSEPETKALMKLCEDNSFEHMVSCHVQGKVIFWKDSQNGDVPGDRRLAEAIKSVTGYTMGGTTTTADGGYAGCFENWFRDRFNKPGICVEFATKSDATAVPQFDSVAMMDWAKNKNLILGVLFKIK